MTPKDAEERIEKALRGAGHLKRDLRFLSDEESVHVLALTGGGVCRVKVSKDGLTAAKVDAAVKEALPE